MNDPIAGNNDQEAPRRPWQSPRISRLDIGSTNKDITQPTESTQNMLLSLGPAS
jgi:hypothetical protein